MRQLWLAAALLSSGFGCIQAPAIVVEDRRSALEEQAAGRVRPLEDSLERALVRVGPERLTSDQVAEQAVGNSAGTSAGPGLQGRMGPLVTWTHTLAPDVEILDVWLVAGCAAEGLDGLLRDTPSECAFAVDRTRLSELIQRENRHRRSVWAALAAARPQLDPERVRSAWRTRRVEMAPCGARIEQPSGDVVPKECL